MKQLNNIVNNLFDIIISSVKIGGGKVKEEYDLIKSTCDTQEVKMWNGGVTNEGINDGTSTKPPNDTNEEEEIIEMNGPHIIYDGTYEEIRK